MNMKNKKAEIRMTDLCFEPETLALLLILQPAQLYLYAFKGFNSLLVPSGRFSMQPELLPKKTSKYSSPKTRYGVVSIGDLFCMLSMLRYVQRSWAGKTRGDENTCREF
jgi:hypothetical protein